MKLRLAKTSHNRIQIDKLNAIGVVENRFAATFRSDKDFRAASKALGIDAKIVLEYITQFETSGEDSTEIDVELFKTDGFRVGCRPLNGPSSGMKYHDSVDSALNDTSFAANDQPLMVWEGLDILAAVDVDVDGWTDEKLIAFLQMFKPCPSYAWVTHGGGLRFLYTFQDVYSAEEIASVAFFVLSRTIPYNTLEIKKSTRHPRYARGKEKCGEVYKCKQDTDFSMLRRNLSFYSHTDKEVQEWLTNRGLEIGKRYNHSFCPVDPGDTSKTDPIIVNEYGVKCYVCEAHGVCYGSSSPGFFPFSAFVGSASSQALALCVRNYAHFEHVKYILDSKFGFVGPYARCIYSALLKCFSEVPDLARIDSCFKRGNNLIRIGSMWTTQTGKEYTKDLKTLLKTLPVCSYTDSEGKTRVNEETLAKLQQPHDLSLFGYPNLTAIYGAKVGTHYADNDRYFAILQRDEFSKLTTEGLRPKYIKNHDIEKGLKVLLRVFPNLPIEFLLLMIAARGYYELGKGLPPFIFVTGPTGSSKSTTIRIAAGVIGDRTTDIVWSNDVGRLREGILSAKAIGSYAVFGEVVKEMKAKKQAPTQALDFLLNLTPQSVSHKMYIGPVEIGTPPVVAFTDTELPSEIKQDKQLARRMVHVHLPRTLQWEANFSKMGLDDPELVRLMGLEYATACNHIMSYVIDTFFSAPTSFGDVANSLGFGKLTSDDEYVESNEILKALFTATCKADSVSGTDAVRWSGRGWKPIHTDDTSEIANLWRAVADSEHGKGWTTSRKCSETDWQTLCGLKVPAVLECRANGNSKIAIRFKHGNKQTYQVNEELI